MEHKKRGETLKVEVIKAQENNKNLANPRKIERMRVAAYCRVSTDDEDQIKSYDSMVRYYTDMIKNNKDWVYAGVYADKAMTGTKDNREQFQKLIQDCKDGKIDMVLAKGDEVRLHPGESFVYDKATCMYRINKVENVGNSSVWKDNILSFKDERIEDVMVKLERWFDVEFVVDTNLADNILITLSSQNATLESVLSELEMISPLTFRYEKKEKKVYVEELD